MVNILYDGCRQQSIIMEDNTMADKVTVQRGDKMP